MPERQFPELSCLLSSFLAGHVSLIHVRLLSAVPVANSRQRWNGCLGEPGWDPEASAAFPQRRALAAVPVLPGERPPAPRAAGPTALVPAGKGRRTELGFFPEPVLGGVSCWPAPWDVSQSSSAAQCDWRLHFKQHLMHPPQSNQ